MHKISKGLFLLSSIVILLSCNEYNRVLKSPNPELKYAKSIEYYENEDYAKTLPLLEELIPLYKGTEKGKKIYYYYCYTNYYLNYMIAAAFHFKRFANTYPHSDEAEDALFMSAFCNYLESPVPSLDQGPTYQALEELQTFANTYPKSPLVDSANKLVDELRAKIETKAYLNAYQYYKIRRYKSAIVAFENFQQEYPISSFTEEVKLFVIKAYYYLAINSIEEKKGERFQDGISAYFEFIDNFADGKNVNEAEEFYARLIRERELYLKEKKANR